MRQVVRDLPAVSPRLPQSDTSVCLWRPLSPFRGLRHVEQVDGFAGLGFSRYFWLLVVGVRNANRDQSRVAPPALPEKQDHCVFSYAPVSSSANYAPPLKVNSARAIMNSTADLRLPITIRPLSANLGAEIS